MSFYTNGVYPHLVTVLGNQAPVRTIRERLIALAEGDVLEIGVGPGMNFGYYDPVRVHKALEPNPAILLRARRQCLGTSLDVEFVRFPGERIPLADCCVSIQSSRRSRCVQFLVWQKRFGGSDAY